MLGALEPAAERDGTTPETLLERLRKSDRLERAREELARRKAIELMVAEAKPIPLERAAAREKLWTPGREEEERQGSGQIWTPGS
jgi:hypothetical protein